MGTRETQRREWREAVARAAEEWQKVAWIAPGDIGAHLTTYRMHAMFPTAGYGRPARFERRMLPEFRRPECDALTAALSAPKPWTRPAKADLGKWTREMRLLKASSLTLLHLDGTVRGVWRSKAYFALRARLRRKRRAAQRRRR